MSEQEINEAIAEACGRERNPDGGWYPDNGLRVGTQAIPDYCGDLNAMHEAEKSISNDLWQCYFNQLARVTKAEQSDDRVFFCATARHRAEAFLRVMGKWKEVAK